MSYPSDPPPMPSWAIEHARAALRIGKSVPQAQQLLVARGLAPAAAEAVVMGLVEERVRQQVEPQEQAAGRQFVHRLLSGVLGAACVLVGYWYGGGSSAGQVFLSILFPLACIWFGDVVGSYWYKPSAGATPGSLVRLGGWALLLLIGLYRLVLVLVSP